MNLGHCIGDNHTVTGSAALDALEIGLGRQTLAPRDPTFSDAVRAAEAVLGADPRPVYCYLGCLHPGLGTVGLIFDRGCCDDGLQGISRCDSGGLVGGIGIFGYLPEDEREVELLALSFGPDHLDGWPDQFDLELTSSYPSPERYALGDEPDTSGWHDARSQILRSHREAVDNGEAGVPERDRRAWTWEARLTAGPTHDRLRCIVLSDAQVKGLPLEHLRELADLPGHVRVLTARAAEDGPLEVFITDEIAAALVGV